MSDRISEQQKRTEEYRKKAAGFGGLFSSGGKKADAMYALLMENEALEEALYSQNEKLRQERTDALNKAHLSRGLRIEDPNECGAILDQALSDPGPARLHSRARPSRGHHASALPWGGPECRGDSARPPLDATADYA